LVITSKRRSIGYSLQGVRVGKYAGVVRIKAVEARIIWFCFERNGDGRIIVGL
jgi:hypothetical protein